MDGVKKTLLPIIFSTIGMSGGSSRMLTSPSVQNKIEQHRDEIIDQAVDAGISRRDVDLALSNLQYYGTYPPNPNPKEFPLQIPEPAQIYQPLTNEEYITSSLELEDKFISELHKAQEEYENVINSIEALYDKDRLQQALKILGKKQEKAFNDVKYGRLQLLKRKNSADRMKDITY